MPWATAAEVPYPAMKRALPEPDAIRAPLSSRQRKARSVNKRAAQNRLPATQYTSTVALVSRPKRWAELKDALSDAAGDVQALADGQRRDIQRVDRAVQRPRRRDLP